MGATLSKKWASRAMLAGLFLALSAPALAQEGGAPPTDDEAKRQIAVPPLGVPIEPHRGLYTDFSVGTYFAFGPGGVSDGQPFLGLGVGYDLTDRLTLGLRLGMGSVAGACLADVCGNQVNNPGMVTEGADSFSLTTADVFFGYSHPMTQQWFVGGKLLGGIAAVGPVPEHQRGVVPNRLALGFGGGLLATTELHTYLNHFVIGADLGARFRSAGGANIIGLEIAARFKYVF
ncbi:MAG: adventurous gliding motility protein CglE [Deltaproteobacteria bacterium]|nr:adventurous gliding motility protein CglE [Deltaproteobacteria bacterium]